MGPEDRKVVVQREPEQGNGSVGPVLAPRVVSHSTGRPLVTEVTVDLPPVIRSGEPVE